MMKIHGSLIREQGVTFAIIVVKSFVLENSDERAAMQVAGKQIFGNVPIVLMAQNTRGTPRYWGRRDIVAFLSKVSLARIPWKVYTVAA